MNEPQEIEIRATPTAWVYDASSVAYTETNHHLYSFSFSLTSTAFYTV